MDIFKFMPNSKTMTDKTQTHSFEFDSEAFAKLWQQKWTDMLKEKGWPENMAMPGMGQMPFMMPFMPNFSGFGVPAANAMQTRIEALEKRIAVLEKQLKTKPKMTQRNKAVAKKPTRKG